MSIDTYANLQSAITNWLGGRTDLITYYPDWITLFEARAARRAHIRAQETSVSLTTTLGSVSLPTDYIATRRVVWNSFSGAETIARQNLEYVDPVWLVTFFPLTTTGTPSTVYTIEGGALKIRPVDDTASAITLRYFAKTAALSGTLNTLFTNYPDLYLYGALAESGGFVDDDAALSKWSALRDQIFDEIQRLDFRERGQMAIRVLGPTP